MNVFVLTKWMILSLIKELSSQGSYCGEEATQCVYVVFNQVVFQFSSVEVNIVVVRYAGSGETEDAHCVEVGRGAERTH